MVGDTLKLSDLDDLNLVAINETQCATILDLNDHKKFNIDKSSSPQPPLPQMRKIPIPSKQSTKQTEPSSIEQHSSIPETKGEKCSKIAADQENLHKAYIHFLIYLLAPGAPQHLLAAIEQLSDSIARAEYSSAHYLQQVRELGQLGQNWKS